MTKTEAEPRPRRKKPARNGSFYPLHQGGLLGIRDDLKFGTYSMPRSTLDDGRPSTSDIGKVRDVLDQAKSLLGISSFIRDIPSLMDDPDDLQRRKDTAYELIGNMYGIQRAPDHPESDIERRVRVERIREQVGDYGQVANGVIDYLRDGITSTVTLKPINVVKDTSDPIDLVLITLDNKYSKRARFEAKRKLILMDLSAKVDQREREIQLDESYRTMNTFLDTHVFNTADKIGETQEVVMVSSHNDEEFAVTSVRTVAPEEIIEIPLSPGEKVTPLSQRFFTFEGSNPIPVMLDSRKKDSVSKVLKMLRKGKEIPAEAMGDEVGFMAIFENGRDIRIFKRHLRACGLQAKTLIGVQDQENSLNGSGHTPKSEGSSEKLRQDKSRISFDGINVEAIFHTYESYANYLYQREVGHTEFEAVRNFNSGVVGLLFPTDIYPYGEAFTKSSTIRTVRKNIEE